MRRARWLHRCEGRPLRFHKARTSRASVSCCAWEQDATTSGADTLRAIPLVAGATGFSLLLLNRVLSGVAPVVDAGSSQSRVDVLVIALAATLALTGFQWLALRPVQKQAVPMMGKSVTFARDDLPPAARAEVLWAWHALSAATRCESVVAFWDGMCIAHHGLACDDCQPSSSSPEGPICKGVMQQGKANYLANLILFPGRIEFSSFLPANASCAIVAPIGSKGVLVAASDTQRGFSRVDQAWISSIADKLEDTISSGRAVEASPQ